MQITRKKVQRQQQQLGQHRGFTLAPFHRFSSPLSNPGPLEVEVCYSMGLALVSSTPVSAKYKFTIVGNQQPPYSLVQDTAISLTSGVFWLTNDSISHSNVVNYIDNGRLKIKCTIDVVSGSNHFHHASDAVAIPSCDLKDSLIMLLRGGDHSDVTLVVAGGREFKAHKNILSARSPVFAKMFKHGMSESISNRVIISEISAVTVEQLLAYIYTGDAPVLSAPSSE